MKRLLARCGNALPTPRQAVLFMLGFQALSLLGWLVMTVVVWLDPKLATLTYLTFVSNWALVASSLSGVVAALSALRAEQAAEETRD